MTRHNSTLRRECIEGRGALSAYVGSELVSGLTSPVFARLLIVDQPDSSQPATENASARTYVQR